MSLASMSTPAFCVLVVGLGKAMDFHVFSSRVLFKLVVAKRQYLHVSLQLVRSFGGLPGQLAAVRLSHGGDSFN